MSFLESSRFGARGRGRGLRNSRGGSSSTAWSRHQTPLPTKPFGATVDSIDIKTLLVDMSSPEISDVEYVASYNWLNDKYPSILVPGSPPIWTPPVQDVQLKQDTGIFFRDTNAAHFPSYPMEPAIRSILALQPKFDLQTTDVVGCGSTIGNILRYASSQTRAFRFDADVVGETVFFIRRENSPTETIKDVRGYGHTFPDSYTTWDVDVQNSVSHQRVIQYSFDDLRFLLRTETDGYLPGENVQAQSKLQVTVPINISLDDALDKLTLDIFMDRSNSSGGQKLQVKLQGHTIPQEQLFDIKTRSEQNTFDMEEILPRLWLNQTSKFLLAYHRYGLFNRPVVKDIKPQVAKWEKDNAQILGQFHAVMRRIVDVLRDTESQQVEISWDGHGPLLITKQVGKGRRALPPDLLCLEQS